MEHRGVAMACRRCRAPAFLVLPVAAASSLHLGVVKGRGSALGTFGGLGAAGRPAGLGVGVGAGASAGLRTVSQGVRLGRRSLMQLVVNMGTPSLLSTTDVR
jgi:hypothetical protein